MRLRLLACAGLLCALPASGSNALLAPPVVQALMSIDEVPSRTALDTAFGSQAPIGGLLASADDPDLGIALPAIRALPAYCPPAPQICGLGTVHDKLASLVAGLTTLHRPEDSLRLRAAIEALGATRSGLDADVTELIALLGNESRDVRAAVVGAIRNICSKAAIDLLRPHLFTEPSLQVKFAITAALRDLAQCPGG